MIARVLSICAAACLASVGGQGMAQLAAPGDLIVSDNDVEAILAVDPVTGDRRLLLQGLGGGARECAIDAGGRLLILLGSDTLTLDLATGAVCTEGAEGCPPPPPIWWMPGDEIAFYTTGGSMLMGLEREFWWDDPRLVSGAGLGSGPEFEDIECVHVSPGGKVYVGGGAGETRSGIVYGVDPVTGDRTIVSGPRIGGGPAMAHGVSAMASDAAGNLIVACSITIFRVDPATGDRVLVSGFPRGSGKMFSYIAGLAVAPAITACPGGYDLSILEGRIVLCGAGEVYGGSFGLTYDPEEIRITGIHPTQDLIDVLGGPPEYMNAILDPIGSCGGSGFGFAWMNSLSGKSAIPAATGLPIFVLEWTASSDRRPDGADAGRVHFAGGCLRSREDAPVIENRLSAEYGVSVTPATHDGSVRIGEFFRRGDANSDGAIDIGDPVHILFYLFGRDEMWPHCLEAVDANDDGELDITDPISLLFWLFGADASASEPPYPGPFRCGPDPFPDRFDCHRAPPGCR